MKITLMMVRRRVPGVVQTNFKPSRISLDMEAVLGRDGAGALGIATNSAINRGRKEQALKAKAPATPRAPMRAAANVGPQSLAILNWLELSPMTPSSARHGK